MAKKRNSLPKKLETIDLAVLETVSGGRFSRANQPDPAILAGMQQLAQAIQTVGGNMAQAKAASGQQMMQMMQQMMQAKGGK